MIACKHSIDCGVDNGSCCAIDEYTRPSFGVCLKVCTKYDGPPRGLGDTVHNVIKKATLGKVKPCGGCKKRRGKLNKVFSYV